MNVHAEVPKPFAPLLDPNVRRIVEESGRSSGKSTTNETVAAVKMLESGENNIWYCRAEKGDVRNSIFSSFQVTLQRMGVERFFQSRLNPFEIRCTLTGATCYFSGINGKTRDDLNTTKGFVPRGSLAMFILDEANEAKSYMHVRAAETTANKFLKDDGKIVYAYNPPPNLGHWAHSYFGKMIENGGTKIYTTYRDIWQLLNPATRAEILEMKRDNPQQFAYWYLGQKISLEGLVLFTFNNERNLVPLDKFRAAVNRNGYQPLYIIYGVDSGVVKDPTAVCAWGIFPDGNLIKLSTFYLNPREIGAPIPNSDQVNHIMAWYKRFYEEMRSYGVMLPGAYNEAWVFDSAVVTQDLMFEFGNKTGFYCRAVDNKSIERDIKRLQNGYFRGVFKILDTPSNAPSLREISTFCYNENNEIEDGQDDHTIDADKYATAHYYYSYMANFG